MAIIKSFWLMDIGTGANMTEEDAALFFRRWRNTGVIPAAVYSDWELETYGDNTGMLVKMKPGTIDIMGYWLQLAGLISDREQLTIAAADPTFARIDRVVAYVHPDNNNMDVKVVTGTPAGSPVAPILVQDLGDEWQESIALVAVAANETSIESGHVTDDRSFSYPDFDPDATVLPTQISPQGAGSNLDADSVDGWEPGSVVLATGGEKTIASGAITIDPDADNEGHYRIDTESDGTPDSLDTITFTTPTDGYVIIISPEHDDRTVILTISGNISTPDGLSIYLLDTEDYVILRYNTTLTKWQVIGGVYPSSWAISIPIGTGAADISTGIVDYYELPLSGVMVYHRLVSEDAGVSIKIDVWKDTYANWPPVDADTIFSANEPELSTAQKDEDTTHEIVITKGDWIGINVDSVTGAQKVTLALGGYRKRG